MTLPPDLPPASPLEQVSHLVGGAAHAHGHLCQGQVIGVRMAILGLGLLGYACPPGHPEVKNLVALMEVERCLADAIAFATGLRPGRSSLKLINLGLLAATPRQAQLQAYRVMPNRELFDIQWVRVNLPLHELPGARAAKVPCARCGILVRDGQTMGTPQTPLCAVCAGRTYFAFDKSGETR